MPDQDSRRRIRHERLLEIIGGAPHVGVKELIRALRVSRGTIQADLRDLEAAGRVRRVWGGVQPVPNAHLHDDSLLWSSDSAPVVGAALVRSGDTVLLACGELSEAIAIALVERTDITSLLVITGDIPSSLRFAEHPDRFSVHVTGGVLRGTTLLQAEPGLPCDETADIAFLPCHRIAGGGDVYLTKDQARVVRSTSGTSSRRTVLLSATDVFVDEGGEYWSTVDDVDAVITGAVRDRSALEALRARGAQILVTG